jgi:hypothetical protein
MKLNLATALRIALQQGGMAMALEKEIRVRNPCKMTPLPSLGFHSC